MNVDIEIKSKYREYQAYKDSGIDWIVQIPMDWKCAPLKYHVAINKNTLSEKNDGEMQIGYIDIGSVDSNGRINNIQEMKFENAPSRARRLVKQGDTIVSTVRTYLKAIAYIEDDIDNLVCSTGFAVITPRGDLNSRFIAYYTRSNFFIERIMAYSVGVSYPAVNASDIARIPLFIPNPKEQQLIVNFLNREISKLDAIVQKKQRLIELLQEKRQALITQLVTKGLNPDTKMKDSGFKWLGEVPAHWDIIKIKYVSNIGYGLGEPPKLSEFGVPIIRATNINRGKIVDDDMIFAQIEDLPLERAPLLEEGEILVVRSGAYTGDSAIITKEYVGSAPGYDLRVKPVKVEPKYLAYCLLSTTVLQNQIYLEKIRAAQPHLNAEDLGRCFICMPKESLEQERIAAFLEEKTAVFEEAIEKITVQIEHIQEYRQALITAVVTGKIDVREEVLA